jgi:hypothetical protein
MDERRRAGVAGVTFAVATVLQFVVLPVPPSWHASGADLRHYLIGHRAGVLAQGWLMVVAELAFVVFLVGLCQLLRQGPGGVVLAATAAVGGAVLTAALLLGQVAYNATVWINGNIDKATDDTVRLAWSMACLAVYGASMPGIVLVTAATAFAGARSGAVPRWSAKIAAAVALLGVAGTLVQFGPAYAWFGLAAFLGLVAFSLAIAIPMIIRRAEHLS